MNDTPLEVEYFLSNNLNYFKPWEIISGDRMKSKRDGLNERFPSTNLFPFAVRSDRDDVACFDFNVPEKVVIIHDYSSVGWENREILNSFWDWLNRALNDMIEFSKEDIEYERKKKK